MSRTYYFAARYSRHAEMRGYRDELLRAVPDARVSSRWIDCHDGELGSSYKPEALACDPRGCWRHGAADLDDLDTADTIVSFTSAEGGGKGGRHIEHGYAIAAGRRLVVVGPRENIFHCIPRTEVYASWEGFLERETTQLDKPGSVCCDGTGLADYAAVPCPNPRCPVPIR